MGLKFFALISFYKISFIYCCWSRSFSELPRYYDDNPKGWYSLLRAYTPECVLSVHEISKPEVSQAFPLKQCSNLPPEAEIMQYGYSFFQDATSATDPITFYDCNDGSTLDVYGYIFNKPHGFEIITYDHVYYEIVTFNQKVLMYHALGRLLSKIEEGLLKHNEILKTFMSSKSLSEMKLLIVRRSIFTVKADSRPSKTLRLHYRMLKDGFYDDKLSYLQFLLRYGTHVRTETSFGGLLAIYVDLETPALSNDEAELYVRKVFDEKKDSIIFYEGGSIDGDYDKWVQSIRHNPSPLISQIIPIHEYIERGMISTKRASMEKILKHLKQYTYLKTVFEFIDLVESSYTISTFMKAQIKERLNNICINDEFYELISKWVVNSHNLLFDMYTIHCTQDRMFWEEMDDEYVISRIFRLIPEVCFTKEVSLHSCVRLKTSIPAEHTCILFYGDTDCSASLFLNGSLYNKEEITKGLVEGKSFKFC